MIARCLAESDRRLLQTPGFNWDLLSHVVNSADAIGTSWCHVARAFLDNIVTTWPTDTPAARIARIAAVSLLARIEGDSSGGGNLYFEEPTPGAMLAAFQKLDHATPFIRFGHLASNKAIFRATVDRREICLVDIGMGSGSQWFDLLDRIASTRRRPPRIRMIGIDVPMSVDSPTDALEKAGESLRRRAQELGVPFSFQAIASPVQHVNFANINRRPSEALVINAAFALHHVPTTHEKHGGTDSRMAVLHNIRALRPDIVTLVEPDSDHNSASLPVLVREVIAHYLTVFDALGSLLRGSDSERQTLEEAFFGREILNILSKDGIKRVERHERHTKWCHRMRLQGFRPLPADSTKASPVTNHEGDDTSKSPIVIRHCQGGQLLCWKNRPLVSAMAWTT